MLAIKRLFASPKNLVGKPSFEKAPWYHIELSGTKVVFKNPPQTMAGPTNDWPKSLNIYDQDAFNTWPEKDGGTKSIFKNYWSYFTNYFGSYVGGHIGGLTVQIIIQRRYSGSGLLDKTVARDWVWSNIHSTWVEKNKERIKNYKELDYPDGPLEVCHYPDTPERLESVQINGLEWILAEFCFGDEKFSRERDYYLPISDEHLLVILFNYRPALSAYKELLDEMTRSKNAFMENFHVKWPEYN